MPGSSLGNNPIRIGFDSERMKNPNSGLGKFCEYLGHALLPRNEFQFQFFQKKKTERYFPEPASYGHLYNHHKIMGVPAEVDIWHCTHQLSKYLPIDRKIPVITTIHDLNFLYDGATKSKIKRKLDRVQHLLDRSAALVYISEFTKAEVEHHLDTKGLPNRVIYNGPALPLQLPMDMPPVRKKPFFFSIGLITAKKNFHVLLPLLNAFPDHEWVIAGDRRDAYAGHLVTEARKKGVGNRLVLTGVVTEQEKIEYYRQCEAFLFPSMAEGFGLPALEALHFGNPVFLSPLPSLKEIGGTSAFYFSDFSEEVVINTVRNGLVDFNADSTRKSLMQQLASLFSWEQAAASYSEMYLSLV
jgi:glycosyltransferase involved in cell wall biosynthesis